jgi:flagellar biosynthesis GTPase FlhF
MAQTGNYYTLIQKLDAFTRRYYLNKLIRGSLITVGSILAVYLVYALLENQFYFSGGTRKFLLGSFILISVASLANFVFWPLAQYYRLGKIISHDQAAAIIGNHFIHIQDKLLNILQLRRQADQTDGNTELLFAGIEQKTKEIELVPFKAAIDLTNNRKYLRYVLPPALVLLTLLIAAPSMIRDSTNRLIHTNKTFEREAPFHFVINPANPLSVVQYGDYELQLTTEGSMVPAEVFIEIDKYSYRLRKDNASTFSYHFKNVQDDTPFRIFAGPVSSSDMTLAVIKKPGIMSFDIDLDYPSYTGRRDENLDNIGDLVVPEGTQLTWDIQAAHTDALDAHFEGQAARVEADRRSEDRFILKSRANKDGRYTLYLINSLISSPDSVQYSIRVIPDRFPGIQVEAFADSMENNLIYFAGHADDDYGIRSLTFQYEHLDAKGNVIETKSDGLDIPHPTQFSYTHAFDLNSVELGAGEVIRYYFEVHDNDAIHGSKVSRTPVMEFRKPTVEEYAKKESQNNANIESNLEKSLKETRDLQEDMKALREKLMQEKKAEWQDKKEIEKLLERHQNLQSQMQDALEKFKENIQNQQEHSKPSEELLEKQEKVEKLFEELMSDEMKDLMKKMEELLKQLEKEGALEMMENFEMNDQNLEKELDRMLELFKQLEVEAGIEKQIQKLEELAKEQEDLSKETEEEKKANEELGQDQEKLNEKFDDVQKDMKELQQKNEALERPKNLEGANEQMEKIDQDMQNSKEQIDQKQNKGASKSQKNASQRMKDMAAQMQSQMQAGEMEQMEEDMAMLRQLLENLVTLSFDQEQLISDIAATEIATPKYVSLVQDQYKIKDDFKVVEDTLQALSKRVTQIESFVHEKVSDINVNLKKSIQQLEERNKPVSADHQQHTMTYLNDLALMLSEVMNQMQQQMSSMMPGSQMCNKPGGKGAGKASSRVPLDKISKGQEGINGDMQKMSEQLKKGDHGKMSKEFAEMAARQAALRKALRDLSQEKKEQGKGMQELDNISDEMNKIEIDLVNKRLSNETLKRQQDIMTRLLEAEKSERQRDQDERRQAETAKEQKKSMPPALEQYIKQREAEIEQYKSVSPDLKPYYKFLVEEYYQSLKNSK